MSRSKILANVPPVGFWGTRAKHPLRAPAPQDVPLPACVAAVMNYLGEGVGVKRFYMGLPAVHPGYPGGVGEIDGTFSHLMAATGAAFRLTWKTGWHQDNVATFLIGNTVTEVFDRAFAWAGRKYACVCRSRGAGEKELREAIVASIDAGVPAIAHGVIGPPEECVITGYDDGGETLIGWSFFQDMPEFAGGVTFETDGAFRKKNWAEGTWSVLRVGEKAAKAASEQQAREILRWALDVIRTPERQGRANGLAAFDAWREHILQDEAFSGVELPLLRERFSVHSDASGTIAEGRWYAHNYCRLLADDEPEMARNLWKAAACFEAQHTLMWELWKTQGGMGREDGIVRRFAEPAVRKACAEIIGKAREMDERAAGHLEKALGA